MKSRSSRRLLAALLLGLVASASLTATTDAAPIPGRTGHYGLNILIDDGNSYSGGRCLYTSGDLTGIRIRRPIAYAYDRTSGLDSQKMSWRYQIDGTNDPNPSVAAWTHVTGLSSRQAATGSERRPAGFLPRTYTFSAAKTFAYYRVVVVIDWYRTPSAVDGTATIAVENYDDLPAAHQLSDGCPSVQPPTTATRPAIDQGTPVRHGNYGVHILIDDDQSYFGAACRYSGMTLKSIRIRQPIVFGFDRTSHRDVQTIGWRYTIQGTNDDPNGVAAWTPVFTSDMRKLSTDDRQPAAFQPRTFQGAMSQYASYNVVVEIYWYYPSSHKIDGKALLAVSNNEYAPTAEALGAGCPAVAPHP